MASKKGQKADDASKPKDDEVTEKENNSEFVMVETTKKEMNEFYVHQFCRNWIVCSKLSNDEEKAEIDRLKQEFKTNEWNPEVFANAAINIGLFSNSFKELGLFD